MTRRSFDTAVVAVICLDPLAEWENGVFLQKPCVFTCIFDEVEKPPPLPLKNPPSVFDFCIFVGVFVFGL